MSTEGSTDDHEGELLRLPLERAPQAAGRARAVVHEVMAARGAAAAAIDNAKLIASELVSNALRHGRGAIELRVVARAERIVIEVVDEGDGADRVRPRPGDEQGGWGLQIVERLAGRWGVYEGTTHVWAELRLDSAA